MPDLHTMTRIRKECKERIKGKGNIFQLNFKNTRTDVF